MSKQKYDWNRFWHPRSGSVNLANGGHLYVPDTRDKTHNSGLVALEEIADVPCLVLLGEPGIGKSQELENLRTFTEKHIDEEDQILSLDLEDCSEEKLHTDLFKSKTFTDWINGTHRLYLFLDSLDQGWQIIPKLPTLLAEKFRQLDEVPKRKDFKPTLLSLLLALKTGFIQKDSKIKDRPNLSRLYLRIACRVAVFSQAESSFIDLWSNSLGLYDLAPLQPSDVKNALKAHSLDVDACLKEIEHKGLWPLAVKPITLQFLIKKLQRNDGQLPHNQTIADIYLDGCRELCRETKDDTQHPLKRVSNLEVDQRLRIAARIAAITILCLRSTIWIGNRLGNDIPNKDVLIRELLGQYKNASNEGGLQLTESAIKEALDTALFTSRESNRMVWSHRTYAEFLAAWYLKQHNLNLSKILSLILHSDSRVVPQLQETMAWLASMRADVFQEIMEREPDMLLQSDISKINDESKAKLVESLLKLHDKEKLKYFPYRRYEDLNYPELPKQLENYICVSSRNQWSRLVAIDIARACDLKALQDSLASIALDPTQLYIIRIHAADTVCAIGDEKTKARLRPLALGEAGDDPEDELKGYGLRAVWPQQHIIVKDLLNSLSQPQQRGIFPVIGGVYQDFIATEFTQYLQLRDLPEVLKWLEQLPKRFDLHYPFRELADSVMLKAWQNLHKPAVLKAFAEAAIFRLKQNEGILGEQPSQIYTRDSFDHSRDTDVEPLLRDSEEKRRQLIEKIVLLNSESKDDFLWQLTSIICSEDVLWIIENAKLAESDQIANIWVKILRQTLNWHNLSSPWRYAKHVDAILEACSVSPAMKLEFQFDITTVELGSEQAENIRAAYLQYQPHPPKPKLLLDPQPKQRVLAVLEKVEAGQPELWWQICVEMTLMPTSIHYEQYAIFEPDLTELPGWNEAESGIKIRIIKAAKDYLKAGDPKTQAWIGTRRFSHPPFAGYQALYLLTKQEPAFILTISSDVWTKWIAVILKSISLPRINRGCNDQVCQKIVRTAYQSVSDAFIETLITLMLENNYQPCTFYADDVYRLTNELLDQCLASIIFSRVPEKNLKAGMLEILLADLFKYDVDKAKLIAASFIDTTVTKSRKARDKAIVAARMLIIHADDSSWPNLWSAIQQDHGFGREVLESIALQAAHKGQIEEKLKEEYIADLYIFLVQQYPEIEQPRSETQELKGIEAQVLEEFDEVRMWKDYIPQRLQSRGTLEACDALRKIIHELPELKDELQWRLLEAEALVRRKTWQPLTPEKFLQFVISQEPSNLDVINQITKKMEEEPKIENKITISNSPNSPINAPVGTSGVTDSNVTIASSDAKKGINWGNWLTAIGILATIIAVPLTMSVSGAFNEEFKQWFKHIFPSKVEQQPMPKKQ